MNDDENEWVNGEARPARVVEVRADELRLSDHLQEGVRIVSLHWERAENRVYVTTDSKVSSRIVWTPDHLVKVMRGEHWRPGLGLNGEHS